MKQHHGYAGHHGTAPPNHLGTTVPSGDLVSLSRSTPLGDPQSLVVDVPQNEKKDYGDEKPSVPPKTDFEEDEEDEDMDALIEELESEDAAADYEEEETTQPGGARVVPEELLQTDTRTGLSDAEVSSRRKKYGLNQMKGECLDPGRWVVHSC